MAQQSPENHHYGHGHGYGRVGVANHFFGFVGCFWLGHGRKLQNNALIESVNVKSGGVVGVQRSLNQMCRFVVAGHRSVDGFWVKYFVPTAQQADDGTHIKSAWRYPHQQSSQVLVDHGSETSGL